jgi:hypothetical protein
MVLTQSMQSSCVTCAVQMQLKYHDIRTVSSSSSSSICGAGRNPAYHTSAFEAVCTLTPVFSTPVHLLRRSTPDGVRDLY